jgi:Flp pilus assembly protein TadD
VKQRIAAWIPWLLAGAMMAAAGALVLRPDARDELRAADRLFAAGRFHEALAAYGPLSPALPEAQLRLGMVRALRGEHAAAERALRAAMQRGLSPADYHLALLYLGRALADSGRGGLAGSTWLLIEDCRSPEACAYRGPGRALAAEAAMGRGDYLAAEAGYRAALGAALPPGWRELAHYRLALLTAPGDPGAGLAELRAPVALAARPDDVWAAPLLPPIGEGPGQLAAVLAAPAADRPQLLGQLYLAQGLYGLAEAQFDQADAGGADALGAAAYAAYTRWRAGDTAGGLARLEALVADHPDEPRARTLLALAYLTADAGDSAREQIDAVAQLQPGDPDVQLAWASWHTARREYAEASLAYDQALARAPAGERERYALLAANFHLATTYELCDRGLPLAELAAGSGEVAAYTTLAAHRYHCGQFAAAAQAAREAQATGAVPEAAYYLGASLAALGDGEARAALIRAADLAPASDWRRRAELALAALP